MFKERLDDFKNGLRYFLQDIRYLTLFPRHYKTTQIADRRARETYWRDVSRRLGNFKKQVDNSDYHWYVITLKDGRKELTYFRGWRMVLPHGGRLCRGLILHRLFTATDYEHVEKIELAF